MRFYLASAVLAALQLTFTVAHVARDIEERSIDQPGHSARDITEHGVQARASRPRTCGNVQPSQEILDANQAFANSGSAAQRQEQLGSVTVNLYFHVVTTPQKQGKYTQKQLNDQYNYMNKYYAQSGIRFNLVSTDFTVNAAWASGQDELQMKTALRKGNYADVNIYFLSDIDPTDFLGICTFPTAQAPKGSENFILDGCECVADTLPGGSYAPYNLGATAVHEVGHWFGLLHVFQGQSCTGAGDQVADTPVQSTATFGCPKSKDSCPAQAGLDSIQNFMDYSDDVCMNAFTLGQAVRKLLMYAKFRVGK